MPIVTASEARKNLFRLLDHVTEGHEPIVITGKRKNAVLVSEEDWRAIQQTLHLAQIPGMSASIREGLETSHKEMSKDLEW